MLSVLLFEVLLKKPEHAVPLDGWPSVVMAYRMYEWFPLIFVAVLIEMALIHLWLKSGWMESLKASAAANLVSALCGFIFLPMTGVIWDYTLLTTFETLTGEYGHFTLASWIGNAFYMSVFLGLTEIPLIAGVTKAELSRGFIIGWMFVNMLTLGMVVLTFFVKAPEIGLL